MSLPEIQPAKLLEIRLYPDPVLKTVCETVTEVTEEIKTLIQNMFITMYHSDGVGLSANQVGISKRIFVMDTSTSGDRRHSFINPEIIQHSDIERYREGCLSFPNIFAYVKRHTKIRIRALNEVGEVFELDLQGIDAVCFQHELDHLSGIVFTDHLSQVQKNLIKKKLSNLNK
jgi:peptide deformylase